MAYSNTWSTTAPTESNQANSLALYDRQTRLNIQERINSIIGVAIGTAFSDPIVDTPHSLNQLRTDIDTNTGSITTLNGLLAAQSLVRYIHPSIGRFYPVTYVKPVAPSTGLAIVQASHGSPDVVMYDVDIPAGDTITAASIYWVAPATSSLQIQLFKIDPTTGTAVSVSDSGVVNGIAGIKTTTLTGPFVVSATDSYALYVNCILGAGDTLTIDGVKISYTSPNANTRR